MFYKVFITNIFNGKKNESILVEDFDTIGKAKFAGNIYLAGEKGSYFLIREYNTQNRNIIGGDLQTTDTGKTVYVKEKKVA